jgi:hypothetical protein
MRRVLKIKTINYAREPILNVYYGYRFRRVSSNGQNPVRPRPKLTPFGPIFQGLRRLSKRWLTWWRPAQQTTHNSARQCRNEIKRKEEESSLSKTCTAPAHNSKIVLIFFFCVSLIFLSCHHHLHRAGMTQHYSRPTPFRHMTRKPRPKRLQSSSFNHDTDGANCGGETGRSSFFFYYSCYVFAPRFALSPLTVKLLRRFHQREKKSFRVKKSEQLNRLE